MVTISASFVIIGLGTPDVKYLWNGSEIQGVIKMFVYKGTSITLTVQDKNSVPYDALKAYGIKVKEI